MRLRADIFVAALIRRVEVAGAVAMLRRRGAAEAGAIFVKVDRLNGTAALFAPAPQSEIADDGARRFARVHKEDWIAPGDIEARLKRERDFDPDLWIVEIEDKQGRSFLD
ncbi:MAG: DUF1491 family protein [Hyphomicrobiales bacterium]|nr:DUF1491 family protein [Hyphomicrobiales bacterium]